jgi:hypothetical protein
MPDYETPAERYRRLSEEALDVANKRWAESVG